jgi:hypothetical protein
VVEYLPIDPKDREIDWSWKEEEISPSVSIAEYINPEDRLIVTPLDNTFKNQLYYLFIQKFFNEVDTNYNPDDPFEFSHCIEKGGVKNPDSKWLLVIKQSNSLFIIDLQKSLE